MEENFREFRQYIMRYMKLKEVTYGHWKANGRPVGALGVTFGRYGKLIKVTLASLQGYCGDEKLPSKS